MPEVIYMPRLILNEGGLNLSFYCFPNGYGAIMTRRFVDGRETLRILQPTKLSNLGARYMKQCGPENFPTSLDQTMELLDTIAGWPDADTKGNYTPPPAPRKGTWQRNDPRGDPWPYESTMRGAGANYEARIKRAPE